MMSHMLKCPVPSVQVPAVPVQMSKTRVVQKTPLLIIRGEGTRAELVEERNRWHAEAVKKDKEAEERAAKERRACQELRAEEAVRKKPEKRAKEAKEAKDAVRKKQQKPKTPAMKK